jgi:hypothetical protein
LFARFFICIALISTLSFSTTTSAILSANPPKVEEQKESLNFKDIKPAEVPKKSSVVVRHLDKTQGGLKVAETTHFRILHEQGKPLVDKVGQVAEETRDNLQRKWFGDLGTDWDGKCSIYLHADRDKYAKDTKMKNTLGHMSTLDLGGQLVRSIHLPCKEPSQVIDVLPHEVSHSVMAVRFQGRTPRWADEGMAMLAETPASYKDYTDRLPRYRKADGLFALEVLTQTNEPDHFNTLEYYAQSTSLVQYLTELKGPQAFAGFLKTYIGKGAVQALRQHYDIKSYADLEARWQAYAFPQKTK